MYVLGDLVCVSVKFFFFFLPLIVPVFGCSKKCGKEMGIWILVGVLKNLLSMAMLSVY